MNCRFEMHSTENAALLRRVYFGIRGEGVGSRGECPPIFHAPASDLTYGMYVQNQKR